MTKKKYNVASGPSVYPPAVLDKIAKGVIAYEGTEFSILEIGHRTDLFLEILDKVISLTKELLAVPDDFKILFLQGGGRMHFAQIPMNFLHARGKVQIIDTGYWSMKAAEYAKAYGAAEIIASSRDTNYTSIPALEINKLDGSYLQYCSNNTIQGTQFTAFPKVDIPTVVDMSSDIFSRKIDFDSVELVMACAQKNFGPAGLSMLLIKEHFLNTAKDTIPAVFSYKNLANKNSNYNTPPIFQICASLKMLEWIKEKGGVDFLSKETNVRAQRLYHGIDQNKNIENIILPEHRSSTNIVFDAKNKGVEQQLINDFVRENISGFKGHKARGGFRIGNYIAQSDETIDAVLKVLNAL